MNILRKIKLLKMIKRVNKIYFGLSVLAALGACGTDGSSSQKEVPARLVTECEVQGVVPEEAKGKIDVYDAMSRAAKYNIGALTENMYNKIYSVNSSVTPKEVVANLLSSSKGQDNKVYNGIRALDYAILYASASLSDSSFDVHDDILEKSAQNLALAAIKSHNDMLFAEKKDKEILKMIADNQKQLRGLDEKQARSGRLLPSEAEYKKALQVNLYKLNDFHDLMLTRQIEYRSLIKDKREKPELDGRKFYELDSLDKKLTAEVFEKSALRYRPEFKLMQTKEYTYAGISRYMTISFDGSYRLDINGYKENNPLYVDAMEKQAATIANKLVDSVGIYQNNKQKNQAFRFKENVYDNLSAAIFTQIELAYNMLQMVELDFAKINKQIKDLKKEINRLKGHELNYPQRMELMEMQTKLVSLEMTRSQIAGERSVAIRALFFYAGYAPFNCPTLNLPPRSIARILKDGFANDAVRMLANISNQPAEKAEPVNEWARGDDWIDGLLDAKPAAAEKSPKPAEPATAYDLYSGEEYDQRKIMQLGAYKSVKNAELEWEMLQELYPQLKAYKPTITRSGSGGKMLNRLVIKSKDGGFRDLCNELRRDKVQCILK